MKGPRIPGRVLIAALPMRRRWAIVRLRGGFACRRASVEWDDLFLGRVALDPARLGGDFIVARNHAGHSYQLAVVADDRGDGREPGDPRQ